MNIGHAIAVRTGTAILALGLTLSALVLAHDSAPSFNGAPPSQLCHVEDCNGPGHTGADDPRPYVPPPPPPVPKVGGGTTGSGAGKDHTQF
jgi:hypothetical protein